MSFPILASIILGQGEIVIDNVPKIRDIDILLKILSALGIDVQRQDNSDNVLFDIPETIGSIVPYGLGSKIRGGLYLLGALLAKTGRATIPFPGGCDIGDRGFRLHMEALRSMGAEVDTRDGNIVAECKQLYGTHIILPYPSKGVTGNLILASTAAIGDTVIENANTSPDLLYLGKLLSAMGVKIDGIGTTCITVHECRSKFSKLNEHFCIPSDKIEVATLLVAGLITQGEVTVNNVVREDIIDFLYQMKEMQVAVNIENRSVTAGWSSDIKGAPVITGFPPAIDPDYEPILAPLLCLLSGKVTIYDAINPERHARYLPELIRMGAKIEVNDNTTAQIDGVDKLSGCEDLFGKDLRGTVALLLAALSIHATTILHGIENIERGYENLFLKLNQLGADIVCVSMED